MTMDIVLVSVDRSNPDKIIANTSVDLLHCRVVIPKRVLQALGYTAFRPKIIRPVIDAAIKRQIARHGGKLPLGGIVVEENDLEDLPRFEN